MVHGRQKERAERADLRLRVRERGDGILVGGGFVPDLLEGFGEWKGVREEREWGPLFLFLKKTKG